MPTAVITGISGQDGSYLARLLLSKGYKVIGIVRKNSGKSIVNHEYLGIEKQIELKEVNLLDRIAVENLIHDYRPNEFYNLAAQSSVGLSFKEPALTFEFNALSVIKILEAIRVISPETNYYQASSSEMFGNVGQKNLPLRESVLFNPASPYACSKAAAHWITHNYREAYGLKACCGILFNHESCLRGENFVIKKIIRTALEINEGRTDQLSLGNLSVQRDWGYAPKFVEAMWSMLQRNNGKDYLICSGSVTSLRKVAEIIFEKLALDLDQHLKVEPNLMRNTDLNIIYGDNARAKKDLNWDYDISIDQLLDYLITDERRFLSWKSKRKL